VGRRPNLRPVGYAGWLDRISSTTSVCRTVELILAFVRTIALTGQSGINTVPAMNKEVVQLC